MAGLTRFLTNTFTTNPAGHGFDDFGPGTVIVDANAFVFSTGASGNAINLSSGAWTVTVNGNLFSDGRIGLGLMDGSAAVTSTVTVGKSAEIFGNGQTGFTGIGINVNHSAKITNSGRVIADITSGTDAIGISHNGDGTLTLVNNTGGVIESLGGASSWGVLIGGDGAHTITNSGKITGLDAAIESAGNGIDKVTNSGVLEGDVILGGGNDYFRNTGSVTGEIDMGAGNDTFIGGAKNEVILDTNGADNFKLSSGNDEVKFGGLGSDLDDIFDGGTGIDSLDLQWIGVSFVLNMDSVQHTDTLSATTQVARKLTGATSGTDTVLNFENAYGSVGGDVIFGTAGANFISGGGAADALYGYAGNDFLSGDAGSDRLYGGLGADTLVGGSFDGLQDVFFFTSIKDSGITAATRDKILGFVAGEDFIDLSAIDANTLAGGDQGFSYLGQNVAFGTGAGAAGQLRSYLTSTHTIIEADVNGDAKADFSIALEGHLALTGAGTDYFTL